MFEAFEEVQFHFYLRKINMLRLIIFVGFLVKLGITENPIFFCKTGEELALEKVCDGLKDCQDGTDERKELCYHTICPLDKFKCNYGACIPRNLVCNQIANCADGSDESNCGKTADSCDFQEYRCETGGCINATLICNNYKDCVDGSDESPIICEHQLCPLDTFRCSFGGCVKLSAICDDFQDCIDGSDESIVLCGGKREDQRCPGILTRRLNLYCHNDVDGVVDCGRPVKAGTVAKYSCKPFFEPTNIVDQHNDQSICQANGKWSRDILKCKPECGHLRSALPLIVGGVLAAPFPWHGTMYVHSHGTWKFWCGSSLLSEAIILTAAHCVWEIQADDIMIVFGEKQNLMSGNPDAYRVKRVITFPLYRDKAGNYASDIALLEVAGSVEFSESVHPVCMDWKLDDITSHLSHDSVGMVMGMGLTEEDKFSNVIKATRLPVVANGKCLEDQDEDFRKYVTFTAFCAGWKNGTGVCNGDSGGGLVFPLGTGERWCLQGIVSLSPRRLSTSYCDTKKYTIFTKVGIYVKWISHTLAKVHATHNFTIEGTYEPIL